MLWNSQSERSDRQEPTPGQEHTHSSKHHLQTSPDCGRLSLEPSQAFRTFCLDCCNGIPSGVSSKAPNRLQHVHLGRPQPSLAPSPALHLLQAPPAHLQAPSRSLGPPQNTHLIPDSPVPLPPSAHLRTFGDAVFRATTPDSLLWTYSRDA